MANTGKDPATLPTTLRPEDRGGGEPGATTAAAASKSPLQNPFHGRRRRAPASASNNRRNGDEEKDGNNDDDENDMQKPDRWWKIHLFRGMINDIRRRAPYYWSDFADAWDYRVVPATVYMYFAK